MEPIAITGIGCKLPGGITTPTEFWAKLIAGADLISETPPDRWNTETYFHANRGVPGHTYALWGGYVSDPAGFDAGFFGLTPREASHMDPQQRWLLEAAWEALEDAGIPPSELAGTKTGVFVGISSCDYGDIQKRGRYEVDMHTTSGSALSIASNRISYLLDLRGPSFSVDTACSSSLVALDLACQSIWRGETPLALLGGANAILQADVAISFAKGGFLSPTGRCKAFAASADGFVRAEGAGVVVLKPLSKALADGDRVYAVIRSTMTNQDGRTGGLTVPSAEQQQAMLEEAYARANVKPEHVGYIEAHGTGTAVGDPLEAAALGKALGMRRPAGSPLLMGSVKSNLGHLEPASGVVGLIKLALAMHHRTIPPNLHFEEPNPRIPFDEYQLRVPTNTTPWEPAPDGLLYGGVNSFGFGGTNAHAVLSSAPHGGISSSESSRPQKSVSPAGAPGIWTVSARSNPALTVAAQADAAFLAGREKAEFEALASVIHSRRNHHSHRLAVVAEDAASASEKLSAFASGSTPAGLFAGQAPAQTVPVAIVFSGQGTQWPGMARDLFQTNPLFRATCEELDAIMKPSWGRSLIEEILRGDETVYQSDIGQPVLFALQVGVYRLYEAMGVRPALVFGHSFGEVAAAFACGALELADAARVIVERAKALELTSGAGVMAAVGINEEEAAQFIARFPNWLSIAAFNSDNDLTLAGDEASVQAVVNEVAQRERFARVLPFPYAFHSQAVEGCREVFTKAIAGLPAKKPVIPFISTVIAGELLDPPDDAYWWTNLRQPVRFSAATKIAQELGAKVFLEVGPHPGLVRYVKQVLGSAPDTLVLGSLRRNESGPQCFAESLASLHVAGVKIEWNGQTPVPHASFPKYPWQRQSFWAECEDSRHLRLTGPTHPLLGVRESGPVRSWATCIGTEQFGYLADHGFHGRAVFPAAGHIELMLAAAAQGSFAEPVGLADLHFDRVLWSDRPHEVKTSFDAPSRRLVVSSRPVGEEASRGWEQCSRSVRWAAEATGHVQDLKTRIPENAAKASADELYARFERGGNHYGPLFRNIRSISQANGEFWAEVSLDPSLHAEAERYYFHPALLDGVFQSVLAATPVDEERESMYVPVRIERIEWRRRAGAAVVSRIRNIFIQDMRWFADIDVYTPDGEWVATFAGCCCLKKPQEAHVVRSPSKVYREEWKPAARSAGTGEIQPPAAWLVVDPHKTGGELVRLLTGAWVGHQTDSTSLTSAFLQNAKGHGAVVVWLAGRTELVKPAGASGQEENPSVAAVLGELEPLLKVSQDLAAADAAGITLWLVASGAAIGLDRVGNLVQAPAAGMLRTIATELPSVSCRFLDLDPSTPEDHLELAFAEFWSPPAEDEIAYRGGERFANQLVPVNPDTLPWRVAPAAHLAGEAYALRTTEPGSLDGLAWFDEPLPPLADHEIEIDVRAVGINFRDVLKALDIYPLAPAEKRSFGDECSGVVCRVGSAVSGFRVGDSVVAITGHGFGNRIHVPAVLAARMPENLSFEQAATIPIAFLTADYCLTDVARLEAGESVLIHAAAGGVGQAAIQIARRIGAEIFGTASPEKHDFLRQKGVRHIFHSRNLSFADGVRAETNGRGVDAVLNSLAGEFIPRTLELLAPGGRFVEIGKKDIFQNSMLDLNPFRSSISFSAVDLANIVARKPEWIGRRLRKLMESFATGELTPLDSTVFPSSQLADAFRLMAQGKHRGKLVVAFAPEHPPEQVLGHCQPLVRPDGSYLITGGLSGLGLRTAEWLADQGAKWLVLAGRSGARSDTARETVAKLASRGLKIEVVSCDVADASAVERLIHGGDSNRPPLRGVVHSAMVLQDEPLGKVSRASLEKVLSPKVAGAWNLHQSTRELPLDWFVMYSSVATQFGSAAQASYVAANRFLDALACRRRAEGLPALALNWGPLAEIGIVADNLALARYLESVGLDLLPPDDVFQFFKFLARRDATSATVVRVDWAKFRENNQTAQKSHRLAPVLEQKAGGDAGGGSDALEHFLACPPEERASFLVAHLRRGLAVVLRADEAALDPAAPLASFGVDSLMAFEFKLRIDRDFRTSLPIDKLSSGTTLTELAMILAKQLSAGSEESDLEAAGADRSIPAPITAANSAATVLPAQPVAESGFLNVKTRASANGTFENLTFDAAALLYIPDRVNTVGGVGDEELGAIFGPEPFVSHLYEMPLGNIGVITLPIRGREMFGSPRVPGLVKKAADLARRRGAKCVSLTGLIPSATEYGLAVRDWIGDTGLRVTTGHATTTAAVILNLQAMMDRSGRSLNREHLAVLGLGSIGQGCLALALDSLPHPKSLILCDVYAKKDELSGIARGLKERHGYRGPVQVLTSEKGLPDGLFEATTILTAVSVPDVIDVSRLRPGTIIVDDSYPPGFSLERGIQRAEADADLLFGNAGMVRLPEAIRETVFLPPGTESVVARLGDAAFRKELARDPHELTACILSSLLTDRHEGFRATLGLAELADLRGHYRGLQRMGITAARPQCGTYFVPEDVVRRFRAAHAAPASGRIQPAGS